MPKLAYKRGSSTESGKDSHNYYMMNYANDNDNITNIHSIITQTTKASDSRPLTTSLINNYNSTINSPRPNSERMLYSQSAEKNLKIPKYLPPKLKHNSHKKTLVLDLDETLVHSSFDSFERKSDIFLKLEIERKSIDIHVLIRPGAAEFLERMSKHFELVIFTASVSKYAEPLIDQLDVKRHCFFRLFREHCTMVNKSFLKDLKRLDRDMKDVIILDNSPIAYALNVENGFPIKSWYEDKKDRELYNLSPILEFLSRVNDVRDYIKLMVDKNEVVYNRAAVVMNTFKQENENESKTSMNNNYKNDKENVSFISNNNYTSNKFRPSTSKQNINDISNTPEPNKQNININIINNNYNYC